MVVRIPQAKFDQFLSDVNTVGNITGKQIGGEDVTDQYFDTEAHLKSLKIQEERMLALLSKSEKLTDIIQLEKELTNCRTQIEELTTTLKRYDNLISYNQVSINIIEVYRVNKVNPMPTTLGEKMSDEFMDSMKTVKEIGEALLVAIVASIPFMVVIFVIGGIAIVIRKRFKKKNRPFEKKDE